MKTEVAFIAIAGLAAVVVIALALNPGRGRLQKAVGETTSPAVNTQCPMMGSEIDPENVPESLTREFHGRKIGFCCAGCPAGWDTLSDEQKQVKLDKAGG